MKSQRLSLTFLVVLFFLTCSQASAGWPMPRMLIAAKQTSHIGEKNKSFGESAKSAYGGSLTGFLDGQYFTPFIGLSYSTLSSKQNFLDNGSEVNSSFSLTSGSAEVGTFFYPLAGRSPKGLNLFISAAGLLGYQMLELSKSHTFEKLPYSSGNISYGGRGGVGLEWNFTYSSYNTKKSNLGAIFEVSARKESSVLLNQNFSLDGIQILLGLSW